MSHISTTPAQEAALFEAFVTGTNIEDLTIQPAALEIPTTGVDVSQFPATSAPNFSQFLTWWNSRARSTSSASGNGHFMVT